ncbi:MAG: hypothetical protein AAGH41_02615 [Pseudomonadota bacterium]
MSSRSETVAVCEIPGGTVTGQLSLSGDDVYILRDPLVVGEDRFDNPSGATGQLDIDAGAVILATRDARIVVNADSSMRAEGLPSDPIVFTAFSDIDDITGESQADIRAAINDGNAEAGAFTQLGQWGSVVLLGRAPTEFCDGDPTDNCIVAFNFQTFPAGGNDANDGENILRNTRFQFGGEASLPSLWLGALGRGNLIENVQVHGSGGGGIYVTGGTVNARQLASTLNPDTFRHALTLAFGYQGEIDRFVGATAGASSDGINITAADAGSGATLFTEPVLANATIISQDDLVTGDLPSSAPLVSDGNTGGRLVNSLLLGFSDDPVFIGTSRLDIAATAIFRRDQLPGAAEPTFFTRAPSEPAPVSVGGAFAVTRDHVGAFDASVTNYSDSWLSPWALEVAFD